MKVEIETSITIYKKRNKHNLAYEFQSTSLKDIIYCNCVGKYLHKCIWPCCMQTSLCIYTVWSAPLFVSFIDLILYVPSTIFQLYRDGSSWVEPVLSKDQCSCLRTQCSDTGEAPTRGPSVLSQALYHWATALPNSFVIYCLECKVA